MVATTEQSPIVVSDNLLKLLHCEQQECLYEGPAGCCGGEVELWNPVLGESRSFAELARLGQPVWVQTLNGPVLAEAPFVKGVAALYRVTLAGGRSTVVTADHKFLTRSGWAYCASLSVGAELLVGHAAGTSLPSESPSGGPHCLGTGAGSLGHCCPCRGRYGPRPQPASGIGPASPPSQGGAHGRSQPWSPAGGQASKSGCSHACPDCGHQPTLGCSGRLDGRAQARSPLAQGVAPGSCGSSRGGAASPSSRGPACTTPRSPRVGGDTHRLGHLQVESQRGEVSYAHGCSCGPCAPSLVACASGLDTGPRSLGALLRSGDDSSWLHYRAEWAAVEAITFLRWDFYYDLHVPGEEHYLADGFWSHNTGKTFGLGLVARGLCEMYPGTRGLFIRQTRKALNTSLLDIWEQEILGHGHPALSPVRKKETRSDYVFPYAETEVDGRPYAGESRVDLVGMDSPERIMSTQYDWAFFIEATEGFLHAWDLIGSRLRRFYIHRFGRPWSLQVADVNPAHEGHWLNVRANQPYDPNPELLEILGLDPKEVEGWTAMRRIKTTLRDNPKFWDRKANKWTAEGAMYNMTLDRMSPVNQKRLRDGLWVSQSGQVYPSFKQERHVVNGRLVKLKDDYGRWRLEPVTGKVWGGKIGLKEDFTSRLVAYFVIAVDWGYSPDPASVGLYAVDDDGHAFRVKGYYETCVSLDVWAERIVAWQKKYDVRAIICDQPKEKVDKLNDLLGHKMNDKGEPIAQVAKKGPGSILAGIETVRWALKDSDHGEPRLRFFANALENDPDQALLEAHAPTDVVPEFGSYCFHERVEQGTNKQLPIDRDNHGMDEVRYFAGYVWGNSHRARKQPEAPPSPYVVQIGPTDRQIKQAQRDEARRMSRSKYL